MKKASPKPEGPIETFIRIVAFPLLPKDHWRPYQVEEVTIQGNKVVGRKYRGKKNTKQQILGEVEISIDPDDPYYEAG